MLKYTLKILHSMTTVKKYTLKRLLYLLMNFHLLMILKYTLRILHNVTTVNNNDVKVYTLRMVCNAITVKQ